MSDIKKTKVVAGFPGTGKSYFVKNNTSDLVLLDSDSSNYSWVSEGIRNPSFPMNYVQHIKNEIGKVDIIFVSTHDVVLNALLENEIPFIVVYPNKNLKEVYLENYKNRGNNNGFINFISDNWDGFISNMSSIEASKNIALDEGCYMMDIVKLIMED